MGFAAVARALRVSVHRKNIAICMAHNCKAHGRNEPSMTFATHVVTRLDSGPGQRRMRLSSHVLVVVFCGLDWGTRRLFPRGI
jgi:hypothetical protein